MFVEVFPIRDNNTFKSLLSNQSVARFALNPDTLQRDCLELINKGYRSNRSLTILLKTKFGNFDTLKAHLITHNWLPKWLDYPKQARKLFNERDNLFLTPVYQERNQLCGLFPGTLNCKTILFYYAVLVLLSKKILPYKKSPIKLDTSRAFAFFEDWLKVDARKLLESNCYRNFVNRLKIDIISLESSAIINTFVSNFKKFPNAIELQRM